MTYRVQIRYLETVSGFDRCMATRGTAHPECESILAARPTLVVVALVLDRQSDASQFREHDSVLHVGGVPYIDLYGHDISRKKRARNTHVVRWDIPDLAVNILVCGVILRVRDVQKALSRWPLHLASGPLRLQPCFVHSLSLRKTECRARTIM